MWFILLVIVLVAQASCQRSVVADLFTFVGWQEHEISSGCTAAGRPANSTALQVSRCSRYRLPRPPAPLLQVTCAEGNPAQTNIHSQRHWQGFIEAMETGWHTALMQVNICLSKHTYKPIHILQLLYLHVLWECQWILGSYGLSGVGLIPFLDQLDTEQSLVLK